VINSSTSILFHHPLFISFACPKETNQRKGHPKSNRSAGLWGSYARGPVGMLLSIALVFLPLEEILYKAMLLCGFQVLLGSNKVLPALKRRYLVIVVRKAMLLFY